MRDNRDENGQHRRSHVTRESDVQHEGYLARHCSGVPGRRREFSEEGREWSCSGVNDGWRRYGPPTRSTVNGS
jgi:hypothetical protein